MQANDWSFIVVELGLVFGGALAFGWWQLRDVARAQRAAAQRRLQSPKPELAPAADPSQPVPPQGDPGLVEPPCRSCTDPGAG